MKHIVSSIVTATFFFHTTSRDSFEIKKEEKLFLKLSYFKSSLVYVKYLVIVLYIFFMVVPL